MRDGKEDSMSHVDEGTLHAYLDGELPPSERAGLEAHVAQCATCHALLADERALLERASALLGSARPAERPVPPFQGVRRAPRRPWYARRSFAWAASLVLAVGLGYYVRGPLTSRAPAGVSEQHELAAVAADSVRRQEPELRAFAKDELVPARPTNQARLTTPGFTSLDSLRRADSFGYSGVQPRVTLRGAAPRPDTTLSRRNSEALPLGLEEAVVTVPPPPAERRAAAAAAPSVSRNDSRSVRNLVSTTWPLISRGKAASLLGDRPVGVPGLATRLIRQSPDADSTVVVEQALDSNTVIQIYQRPATAVDNYDASRERAVLARYVGRLRVEITGPVSTDSLNKLLEQVEPIP